MKKQEEKKMTKEERLATMESLHKSLVENVELYNTTVKNPDEQEKALEYLEEVDICESEYIHHAKILAFDKCAESTHPAITAAIAQSFSYYHVKTHMIGKRGTAKIPQLEVVEQQMLIDFTALESYTGGIGIYKDWYDRAISLNYEMTLIFAHELSGKKWGQSVKKEIMGTYAMAKEVKAYDSGDKLATRGQVKENLQRVINALIGDCYTVTDMEVSYLYDVYAVYKKGKETVNGSVDYVATPKHSTFIAYIASICHKLVTDMSGYNVRYPGYGKSEK